MQNGEPATSIGAQSPKGVEKERLLGLDGLRAFAVLLVILAHYVPGKATDPFFERCGSFGVEIFFVLSGFLITFLLLKEERTTGSVSLYLFCARRALRILPPLFLYLGVLAVLTMMGVLAVPTNDLLAGVLFVRNYVGSSMETTHLWTLAIEEQFYLVWPCLLGLCRNNRARLIGCAAIVLLAPVWLQINYSLAGGGANVNNGRTDLKLQPLMMGGLLAFLLTHERFGKMLASARLSGSVMTILSLAVLAALNFTTAPTTRIIRAFVQPVTAVSVAVLINCAVQGRVSWLNAILNFRPLAWVGRLSYSIYLWQELFAPGLPNIQMSWYREYPVNLALMIGMACLSYYGLERPLLSLRHRLRPEKPVGHP